MKPKDEKKLEAVIAATCRLATEEGLLGITLAKIAKAAGIGTSTLYVYFNDKEALFNEVYRRAKGEALQFYSSDINPALPLKARVRAIWNKMLDYRLRQFDQASFMEQFVGSSFMNQESHTFVERRGDALVQIALEGQKQEILKEVPIPFLHSMFIGSVRETARLIRSGVINDNEESREIAFHLCWDGIRV